jgi:hypothetical protein
MYIYILKLLFRDLCEQIDDITCTAESAFHYGVPAESAFHYGVGVLGSQFRLNSGLLPVVLQSTPSTYFH